MNHKQPGWPDLTARTRRWIQGLVHPVVAMRGVTGHRLALGGLAAVLTCFAVQDLAETLSEPALRTSRRKLGGGASHDGRQKHTESARGRRKASRGNADRPGGVVRGALGHCDRLRARNPGKEPDGAKCSPSLPPCSGQSAPAAIGGHARHIRIRDQASGPDDGQDLRNAGLGGADRGRVRDRHRVRVTHRLAQERAGGRGGRHRSPRQYPRCRPARDRSHGQRQGVLPGQDSASPAAGSRRPVPAGSAG